MKKRLALLLCLMLALPVLALAEETEITLWTYPIGSWGKADSEGRDSEKEKA